MALVLAGPAAGIHPLSQQLVQLHLADY
jgi:hypothetical protein